MLTSGASNGVLNHLDPSGTKSDTSGPDVAVNFTAYDVVTPISFSR
jgi:hypothetical protein